MTTDRRLERLRQALEADATPAKGKTRAKPGKPLDELWTIARQGESESARVSALRLLLAHEERPEVAEADSRGLLRRIASDASVSGTTRLKALERAMAEEERERQAAERDALSGVALFEEMDAHMAVLVLAEWAHPRLPRLGRALLDIARNGLRAPAPEPEPDEVPRVRPLDESQPEPEPEPEPAAEPAPAPAREPREPPEGIDPRAGWPRRTR